MARKNFKAEEIIQHLRTVELEEDKGHTLEESAKKVGVTPQTIIRWRKEYGGLRVDQAKRLKELEGDMPASARTTVVPSDSGSGGLAEARNMKEEDARALVERWADEMERCMTGLEAQGLLVEGAVRVVAVGDASSGTPALNVKLAPGDAVAQNALLCIVAPVRASSLPVSGNANAAPGLAIEATWGPNKSGFVRADAGASGP